MKQRVLVGCLEYNLPSKTILDVNGWQLTTTSTLKWSNKCLGGFDILTAFFFLNIYQMFTLNQEITLPFLKSPKG